MEGNERGLATTNRAMTQADPNVFLAFDRLDDDQIVQEMKGAALQEYVYEFSQNGQVVRGLSKAGTDDAARIMAVKYGEALCEVDCWLEREDEEAAYFKAKVARVIIKDDGSQIQMDTAIGHKRQAKRVGGAGSKVNNFWYEQGGQKALRNAKQKLMPETIKQTIIAAYVEQGKVRRVRTEELREPSPQPAPAKPSNQPQQPQRQTANIIYTCADCNKEIGEGLDAAGIKRTGEQIAAGTMGKWQVPVCANCHQLRLTKEKAAKEKAALAADLAQANAPQPEERA